MGLIEPLKEIPRLLRLRGRLIRHWTANPPDVFVGIDAPDFNLGVERRLRSAGISTVHYVSPSVWAWRQGRIKTIRRACDRVLCLLPFEKRFYDEHGVDAVFVGHPKAGELSPDYDVAALRERHSLPDAAPLVALLPGSRMRITAEHLEGFGLVDEVLEEPLGGAHRNPAAMAELMQNAIGRHLDALSNLPLEQLLEERQRRLDAFGAFRET